MKLYLQLKSWQLFILLVAPMFLPAIFVNSKNLDTLFVIASLMSMIILIGWLYSIAIASNARLSSTLKKNTVVYKIGCLIPFIYVVLLALFFFPTAQNVGVQHSPVWLKPLHLASMFGIFYALYFTAKQFTTLKNGCEVKFSDYSGIFFLFWFYLIGVWFIQPKVNKLLA